MENSENDKVVKLPQKRYFRQRAHANPFSDHHLDYPLNPASMNWQTLYPKMKDNELVEFADIGCGYGGLLISLSTLFPDTYMLGMEIRLKVSDYVSKRIEALRKMNEPTNGYNNIAVIRTNSMKFLPNFFVKGQLTKMFFLFPDPHFKKKKHKARIITDSLLDEYGFFLRKGGMLYTATDVLALHEWMVEHLDRHLLFKRIPNELLKDDAICKHVLTSTEEGKKVERNKGDKYLAVYERV